MEARGGGEKHGYESVEFQPAAGRQEKKCSVAFKFVIWAEIVIIAALGGSSLVNVNLGF